MQLIYANEQNTMISVTLDEGEALGHLSGPVMASVPTDPANMDYAAIVEQKLKIADYQSPAEKK